MVLSRSDNTLRTARNLDLRQFQGSRIFGETLGPSDRIDVFKFRLTGRSSVSITLKQLRANVDVELLNSRGGRIKLSNRKGTKSEKITRTLAAGSYFIRTKLAGGKRNTRYVATVSTKEIAGSGANPPGGGANAGGDNLLSGARDLGTIAGLTTINEFVGATDAIDYYKFNFNQIQQLSITLNDAPDFSTNLKLIQDKNSNGVFDTGEVVLEKISNYSIATDLPVGTYYLAVERRSNNNEPGQYQLNLTPTPNPGNLAADPGSSTTTATLLANSAQDYLGLVDSSDFYRFDLTQITNITATLNDVPNFSTSFTLIHDKNNNGVFDAGESVIDKTSNYSISTDLPPGSYYIKLEKRVGGVEPGRYELSLTQTPKPGNLASDPGNSTAGATPIAIGSTATDYVGLVDDADFYKLSLTENRSLTITLTDVPNFSTKLSLIHDKNNNGVFDTGELLTDRTSTYSFSQALEAGNYYIAVQPRVSSGEPGQYNLILTAA